MRMRPSEDLGGTVILATVTEPIASCQGPYLLADELHRLRLAYAVARNLPWILTAKDGGMELFGPGAATPAMRMQDHRGGADGWTGAVIEALADAGKILTWQVHGPIADIRLLLAAGQLENLMLEAPLAGLTTGEQLAWLHSARKQH
jgi:hypothetical protein